MGMTCAVLSSLSAGPGPPARSPGSVPRAARRPPGPVPRPPPGPLRRPLWGAGSGAYGLRRGLPTVPGQTAYSVLPISSGKTDGTGIDCKAASPAHSLAPVGGEILASVSVDGRSGVVAPDRAPRSHPGVGRRPPARSGPRLAVRLAPKAGRKGAVRG